MKALKFCALALLSGLAASCGKQFDVASDVALKYQNGAAVQRQIELLQAEQVKVSGATAGAAGAGPAVLSLEVVNPVEQHPDTLKQRMRQLARLLVADLGSPDRYQVVNAQATFKHNLLSRDNSTSSQAFIYPIASLR
ncbi:hypothetical protein FNT36_11285 [Hymenobacter setariae]|uniref:Lipoprotein n=1 Tax=Hymenobacter setariae TaxID=2594794 RepID=A0A558BU81_9BACT|nr:hypothetical protein [Hymenobacter setariae]TVT40080.1 hypothetical protein FNT36_11285 [Hymenobacter setariae]